MGNDTGQGRQVMPAQIGTGTPASDSTSTDSTPEVTDERDTSPRGPAPDTSGKRVRAIPYQNESTIIVDKRDFEANGIKDQGQVKFDFRKDRLTLPVDGKVLTEAGAKFLTEQHGHAFEYIDG
jgi:hypothetical protein